jgi:hypothetical protein
VVSVIPVLYINYAYAHGVQVDKIVVAQESLQEFINALSPGAYSSITKVNFKILDNVVLKPFGIYGSKEEIVRFLREIKAVDDSTYVSISLVFRWANASGTARRNYSCRGMVRRPGFLSQFLDLDYILCAPSCPPPKSKPMSSTGRKIPLGTTVRLRPYSVTESLSCGTVNLPTVPYS